MTARQTHILIINGPNLNLLGKREKHIYGDRSFEAYVNELDQAYPELEIGYFQSNHEGNIIDKIHEVGFDSVGIILNPGAYSHTSIAIRDAIAAVEAPVVEVHISNVYEREHFRWHSYITEVCVHAIIGHGLKGYREAIDFLINYLE